MHSKRTMQSVVSSERWAGRFHEVCFCCMITQHCICLEWWEMHLFTFSIHLPLLLKCFVLSTFTNRTSVIYRAQSHIFCCCTQLSSVHPISSHPSFTFYSAFSPKQCENFARQMILSAQVSAPPWWVFKRGADICLQKTLISWVKAAFPTFLAFFSLWTAYNKHFGIPGADWIWHFTDSCCRPCT